MIQLIIDLYGDEIFNKEVPANEFIKYQLRGVKSLTKSLNIEEYIDFKIHLNDYIMSIFIPDNVDDKIYGYIEDLEMNVYIENNQIKVTTE